MTPSTTSATLAMRPPSIPGSLVGTGLGRVTEGTSVTGHTREHADRLLIRPPGGPGRCRRPQRQVLTKTHGTRGQISAESVTNTSTEPDGETTRLRRPTHSQIGVEVDVGEWGPR
jgi:hypothetical protein